MRRHRDGELSDLVRHTVVSIGGPYTGGLRAFGIVLAIVVPLISAIVVVAWVGELRDRGAR